MSRLDDIIDLIQTTNEVYFITAPGRVRTAFILVDDIVELTLKTFLQEKALEQRAACQTDLETAGLVTTQNHRTSLRRYCKEDIDISTLSNDLGRGAAGVPTLQGHFASYTFLRHWSANNPSSRNTFDTVINEVKVFFPSSTSGTSHPVSDLLDEALQRHTTRNKFYHNHHQTGLTIDDDKCLRALCGLFDLMEHLFHDFIDKVKQNHTVRCQIGVLRLKKTASVGQMELSQPYTNALEQIKRGHRYDMEHRSIEHSLVHTVSDRFFRALCEQFKNKVAELQTRIDRINAMAHPHQKHLDERTDKQQLIQILRGQLNQIQALLSIP
ncbi:MAG: hypothetical protein KME35_19315 [Aphanocapsa sp. GSE-SYN-MK-11-07L]|jgi:hypothetical protein|nr:hypothetical protein [Aphanocapsa sp. GSE-SYN-MK-11-07L]